MTSKAGIEPGGVSNKVQTQDAAKGEDVTLDCHVGSDLIGSIKLVEWRFNGEVNVLVYKSKDFSLDDQGAHFRGRASKGHNWNVDKGNLPLKIKTLQESDAGIYNCSVSTGEDPKGIISIKLNVNEGDGPELQNYWRHCVDSVVGHVYITELSALLKKHRKVCTSGEETTSRKTKP
ncbi:hypothetical protein KUCAC02_009700 [Chaenocephalus aceratus]|nr:hypothetical protein KUCAC02_009700 [Chaenocephalus aceratus]